MRILGLISIMAIMATAALAQQTFPISIPPNLSLCYTNASISNRFRRMPQSIDNLVALIRKVEAHPDTALWSIGKMAVTLIHRFRYDGIVDLANVSPEVVPITAERAESDKFRMQWRILPGTGEDFPESALTLEEKCSLHWMLSYTVNNTIRSEELPPTRSVAGARSLPNANAGSDSSAEHDHPNSLEASAEHDHDSHPASADHDEDSPSDHEDPVEDIASNSEDSDSAKDPEEENSSNSDGKSSSEIDDSIAEGENDIVSNSDAEEVHEEVSHSHDDENNEETVDEFVQPEEEVHHDDDEKQDEEVLPEEEVPHEEENLEHHQSEDESDDTSNSDNEDYNRRKRQATLPQTARPMEGGVVFTKQGTVAIGPVLAGIAAGAEPQVVQLKDFVKDPAQAITVESMERSIDNTWVTTLAGDIAQTSLLRVPRRAAITGPRGQWNNTFCPREYQLNTKEHSMLTTAELYGGIDGLLMSRRIATWGSSSSSFLKLSSLLEMYYSDNGVHGDSQYRACNRLANYKDPNKIDQNMLKTQSLNAALVMYARGIDGAPTLNPTGKPVDQIGVFVNATFSEINQYIGNNNNVEADFAQCAGAPGEPTTDTPATYTDLTFVVDQLTDLTDIDRQKELIATLANTLDIQVGGSRLEVVSGKDASPFIVLNATLNRADLACRISSLPIHMSERRIADTLSRMRTRILSERSGDRAGRVSGANTRAIIFFVNSYTSNTSEKDKIRIELEKMLKDTPDVHIMFATLSSPEDFRPFVDNFDRDIIRMNGYTRYSNAATDIAKRLTTVGARLLHPSCSDVSSNAASLETQFVYSGYLNKHTVQYFRIGAEHFFTSTNVALKFKSTFGVAKYCWSRTKENPGATGDSCKSALKADETVEFKFTQPCSKMIAGPLGCEPIYISIAPINIEDNIPCLDKSCHTPDQVKFTFTHEGMRCNSANIGVVLSNMTLLVAAFLSWFINNSH